VVAILVRIGHCPWIITFTTLQKANAPVLNIGCPVVTGARVNILVDNRWLIIYGHLSDYAVKVGDIVERGQVIGLSGGDPTDNDPIDGMSYGAHLHLEIRDTTKPQTYPLIGAVDPETWLATDLDTQSAPEVSTTVKTITSCWLRTAPVVNEASRLILLPAGKVLPAGVTVTGDGREWLEMTVFVAKECVR
jgi:hypothetical protein